MEEPAHWHSRRCTGSPGGADSSRGGCRGSAAEGERSTGRRGGHGALLVKLPSADSGQAEKIRSARGRSMLPAAAQCPPTAAAARRLSMACAATIRERQPHANPNWLVARVCAVYYSGSSCSFSSRNQTCLRMYLQRSTAAKTRDTMHN